MINVWGILSTVGVSVPWKGIMHEYLGECSVPCGEKSFVI